jgi:hypothetical protein
VVIRRLGALILCVAAVSNAADPPKIGEEKAVAHHLADDDEFRIPLAELIAHGKLLFQASWTAQDGGGRPLTKGNGRALADPDQPLTGIRSFNRLSGPDANSCAGCHNAPYGIPGGGGDFVGSVFVLGQRFDFATLDPKDAVPTRGARDENGELLTVQSFANLRATTGMFGAGYLEMLSRQITADLQAIRDSLKLGQTKVLTSKGIDFGKLTRRTDGLWDTSKVEGLPRLSLLTTTGNNPPNLIIRPWHQAGNVISLREFTNNALNQHHGIQSTERFGVDTDPDGDGVKNEVTRADVTALTVYQAVLAVPGRVIPNEPFVERAIWNGEQLFDKIGCSACHISKLPLDKRGWVYEEPGPYNPPTNLRRGDAALLRLDLTNEHLPQPRLQPAPGNEGIVWVPAYTDFKLHDITNGSSDPAVEPLDMNVGTWSVNFGKGNGRFLTKRLWGCANEPPYFHHGLFTTLRQAVLAHSGEAFNSRRSFEQLPEYDRNSVIEFLKSLQVLPPNTPYSIVDENFHPKQWPPVH